MTLVASVPAKATAYSASPWRSALTIGMTVVTASAWIAARKMSATAPTVTQTYCERQMPAERAARGGGHARDERADASTASVGGSPVSSRS